MVNRFLYTTLFAVALLAAPIFSVSAQTKYLGGDISMLPKYEEAGSHYYDTDGTTQISNVLTYLQGKGCNSMRVRLFVDPSKASETHKGEGVCQDLAYVKVLGKRIKDAGMSFLLDIHYSDTWTDPGQHSTPSAWQSLSASELATKVYDYTKETLQTLVDDGATPDFIQVGNELNLGMLWNTGKTAHYGTGTEMTNFISYIKKACEACREVCPSAKIVFHTAMSKDKNSSSKDNQYAKGWPSKLAENNVDYDILGLSYYPYYHGPLDNLEDLLSYYELNFPSKKIQLVETGYPHVYYPTGDGIYDYTATYPGTDEGQKNFTDALIEKLLTHPNVNGLYWWFPEANEPDYVDDAHKVTTTWYNMGLWDNSTHKAMTAVNSLSAFLGDTKCWTAAGTDESYFEFDVLDDGKARIRYYTPGTTTGVNIPETVTDKNSNASYTVSTIGAGWGIATSDVTWMTLPASVTTISDYAFKDGNSGLEITFNNVPTSVGSGVFDNVTSPVLGITYWSLMDLKNAFSAYSPSFKTWGVVLNEGWNNTNNIVTAKVTSDITVTRTLRTGYWNTLTLPFAMNWDQMNTAFGEGKWKVFKFNGVSGDDLDFTEVWAMDANTPYMLRLSSDADITSFTLPWPDTDMSSDQTSLTQTINGYSFVGTLNGYGDKVVPEGGLFINADKVYRSKGKSKLKGLSGYFTVPSSAQTRNFGISVDGRTTGIRAIATDEVTGEGKRIYRLNGQQLNDIPAKGLYIQNGKKFMVK